jgi:hypothetical protein
MQTKAHLFPIIVLRRTPIETAGGSTYILTVRRQPLMTTDEEIRACTFARGHTPESLNALFRYAQSTIAIVRQAAWDVLNGIADQIVGDIKRRHGQHS